MDQLHVREASFAKNDISGVSIVSPAYMVGQVVLLCANLPGNGEELHCDHHVEELPQQRQHHGVLRLAIVYGVHHTVVVTDLPDQ